MGTTLSDSDRQILSQTRQILQRLEESKMHVQLYGREEVQEFLRCGKDALGKLIDAGELPVVRLGRKFQRFRHADVLALIDRFLQRGEGS